MSGWASDKAAHDWYVASGVHKEIVKKYYGGGLEGFRYIIYLVIFLTLCGYAVSSVAVYDVIYSVCSVEFNRVQLVCAGVAVAAAAVR